MAKSLEELFGKQTQPKQINQSQAKPLSDIFASPAPSTQTKPPMKFDFIPSHSPYQAPPRQPSLATAWARGTLGSLVGRAVTPLAEKVTGRKIDISTLPESNTLGQKALGLVGNLGADLPLWVGGEALLARPLAALAKTKPIAKGIGMLPKKALPALTTGVKAGTVYGGPINVLETGMNGDGLGGFTGRLKEAPLMGLGGVALHGAGQAIGKGIREGVNLKSNLVANKRVKNMSTPEEDFQRAFFRPNNSRATALQQQYEKTFADVPLGMNPPKFKPLQQGIDEVVGIRQPLSREMLQQREMDAQNAFGGPIRKYDFQTGKQKMYEDLFNGPVKANDPAEYFTKKPTQSELENIWKPANKYDVTTQRQKEYEALFSGDDVTYTPMREAAKANATPELRFGNKTQADIEAALNSKPITETERLVENYSRRINPNNVRLQPRDLTNTRIGKPYPTNQRTKTISETSRSNLSLKRTVKQGQKFEPLAEPPFPPRVIPPKPSPLTWTNREAGAAGTAGPLPIRSITEGNLGQLPGRTQTPLSPVLTPRAELPRVTPPSTPTLIGTAESFRAKVDRNPVKGKTFAEKLRGLRTQFVDDVAPLENVEKSINGKVASAEESIYKQARLFRGSAERSDELIQSTLSPIIKRIEKSGKTTKDLGDYALAIHARDVNAKGINSGFTNEEIAATIQKYGAPEMEASRLELMKISNDLLDQLAEGGLIDQGLVTALKQKHPNYMPLFRSFEDDKIEFATGVSKAMANVTAPINRLVGSDRNVIDPIESMIKNIYKSISAVDRNKVAGQLGKLADNDTNSTFIRRLAEGEEKSRLNTVYAMENGAKVHYEVQPDVYKALMNLDKESSNMLIKVLQKPAGLLRSGATLTPEFSLRNPMRDVVQAYAVSKSGFNPITDTTMGLINVIGSKFGKNTLYNQFLKDNAGFGNIISMDRKVHQEVIKRALSQSTGKKFVNVVNPKSWIRLLRTITDVTESATKLGEYRAALRSGASRPEAAYRARDLMDFARAGASVRETNKIVAFLNANIQGKSKLYRAIKEDPIGVTTRAFTSITLPTIGVYMAQKYLANDEQKAIIDDAPDWMTSTFWLVPIPGTNQVARIPKPFDMAPIFANLPERVLKYVAEKDPEAFEGFGKQTLASASIPTMITGLIPFIEGMSNYSFFRQGPIIPQRETDLNYPDQYDIRTTETAKLLAKGVNKLTGGQGALKNFGSPRIMDNTIRGATAGLGSYATSAIDFLAETSGLVDKKNKPARNINEFPLLRAFLVSEKSGGKSMDKLYNEKDKLLKSKGSAKLTNSEFTQGDRLSRLSSAADEISEITKEIRRIENNRSINPQSKREQINTLAERRNVIAKRTRQ